MMPYADLVVSNPRNEIVLIVESKNRTGTSSTWAAETRRNMLAHGTMPNSPYFLLALPDRFYLWKDAGDTPDLVAPTYEIDAIPFLQPYYEKAHLSPYEIGYYSFELLITAWINELINWGIAPNVPEDAKKLLQATGLPEILKDATLAHQTPA